MHIKIRKATARNGDDDLLLIVSKMTQIQELREMIFKELNVEAERQKLFYKGKLLVDDHCLIDYGVQLNHVIQINIQDVRPVVTQAENNTEDAKVEESSSLVKAESRYYKIGDFIDHKDMHGAWFEAKITDILKKPDATIAEENNLVFKIYLEGDEGKDAVDAEFDDIRPRSHYNYEKRELKLGLTVLINYNIETPNSVGYWYDFEIKKVSAKALQGTLFLGKTKTPLDGLSIKITDDVWRIETPTLLGDRNEDICFGKLRKVPYNCLKCKDNPSRKCKGCGCVVCAGKNDPDKLLLCDDCNDGYHLYCLTPPLTVVPKEEDWYCPSCKTDENEIVKAGDKLKKTKVKKGNAATSRDWGRGMACMGRDKECTIVPKNHIGSIPGVEVGTCWKNRSQVSGAGIHRPMVAGIHGRASEYAFSLVLSGGYEDDIDNGEEFYYTGSGGRDLSGNKRVSKQSCDQTLTLNNKALALNCHAKFNNKVGAEAEDWKAGKAVRVVRNYKLGKHSKYAPKIGNRYDGTYKVVKYFPQKGLSGFVVWRYLLRRDDPTPPPWSKDGQEFDVIYPEGHLEAEALKESNKKKKRPSSALQEVNENAPKRQKVMAYKLDDEVDKRIKNDKANEKLWIECKGTLPEGKTKFLKKVEEIFTCICCQELVFLPITTECKHNMCKACLKRSFSAEIYSCPFCRFEFGKEYKMDVNTELDTILKALFAGYELSR